MEYIVTNRDRLALVDLLQISFNVNIIGLDTNNFDGRKWVIISFSPEKCVVSGKTIEEAINSWFMLTGQERPKPMSIYQAKKEVSN